MTTILIIEDEKELVQVLQSYLEKKNYRVISAYRGDVGYRRWKDEDPV